MFWFTTGFFCGLAVGAIYNVVVKKYWFKAKEEVKERLEDE